MADARVDKKWQSLGLKDYSTEAILGTLGHYGVQVDEAGFKALAKDRYPLGIVGEWHPKWKGTGQFSLFPSAAVQELWRRWVPEKLSPGELTSTLAKLMNALQQMVGGAADAPVGQSFKAFEELKAKLPQKDGGPERVYVEEAFAVMPHEAQSYFDGLAQELAREGHEDDAQTFAELEEHLFPERKDIAQALVKAELGKKDDAEALLNGRLTDGAASLESRTIAVDALIHIGAAEASLPKIEGLLDEAEKKEDLHVALALVERLAHVYQTGTSHRPKLKVLEERAQKLAEAHNKAHPHHHG